jgi:Ca-activated chloride channel homolog
MSFASPEILWLLLVLPPVLLVFFWWSLRKRRTLMTRFIQARLLPGLVTGISPGRRKLRLALLVLAVVCLLLALGRPQWGFTWQEVKQRGVDLVVAIDTSKSMLAEDIKPNRLARAKLAALDLMRLAKSDRLGLVVFAGSAFLQCPLTIDDAAFAQSVESLGVGSISDPGTALASAIETAVTAFKEEENHKVLVLMTDGEDHDSEVLAAAEKAAQAGMRIYTVGIGTPEGELLRFRDPQGREDYVRDPEGNVVKSHLDELLLQKIAGATGGFYLPLRGAKTIDTLYDQGLAKLPKSEHQEKLVKQYHERFHWPLGFAILALLAEMLLPERRRANSLRPAIQGSEKAPIAIAASVILIAFGPQVVSASTSSALREYKAGKYEQAFKDYQDLLKRNADDPRLHFNAGASAYRSGQYDQAAKEFNAALGSTDLSLQAPSYYNRGNSMYRLGENIPDPNKRMETWQKSLKDFELSLKLNPQDPDAKFNHEFVKKRLEELKQQQQQSQQNKSDQQNQDQQQQPQDQQHQEQNQQKQEKDPQNQQQQQQAQQGKSQPNQGEQGKPQSQDQQQQAAAQSEDQKRQQTNSVPAKPDSGSEKEEKEATGAISGQMTPEQARQLLDSQKSDEKMLTPRSQAKPQDRTRPIKDW